MIGNSWTPWEYIFYGTVIFFVSALNLILDNWIAALVIVVVCVGIWRLWK